MRRDSNSKEKESIFAGKLAEKAGLRFRGALPKPHGWREMPLELKERFAVIRRKPWLTFIIVLAVAFLVFGLWWLRVPNALIALAIVVSLLSFLFAKNRWLPLFIIALLTILPFIVTDQYWLRVVITVGLYVILALGLNVIIGFTGMLDLGFIAFYGIGAYTTALLILHFHLSFWLCLLVSIILGALVGVLRGLPTLRLSGDYLAIVTLGFGEIMRLTFTNWVDLTRGPMGLPDITPPKIFGLDFAFKIETGYIYYYFLILLLTLITILVIDQLRRSRVGRAWMAIREDEVAASVIGVRLATQKSLAYAVGAGFGAMAGSFFAGFNTFVSPNSFSFFESAIVLCMVVIGGIGTIPGAIIGAILLSTFPELLRFLAEWRYLIFGALMVVVAIFRPMGIMGKRT
jgi:branched-chain amino acid transport system permease protein